MIRFRVAEAQARGEYLVEAVVPSCGNDAALIAVFNSECAASKFAEWANSALTGVPREPPYGDD